MNRFLVFGAADCEPILIPIQRNRQLEFRAVHPGLRSCTVVRARLLRGCLMMARVSPVAAIGYTAPLAPELLPSSITPSGRCVND
jgi:hypothetical protein